MRIFFTGSSPTADTMEKHIIDTFYEMGHDVCHFNIKDVFKIHPKIDRVAEFLVRNVVREPERLLEKRLIKALETYQPDLVLVLLGNRISPKTINEMRRVYKGKIVCWCQDQLTTLGRQYVIGSDFDKVFVKDHYLVDVFKNYAGMNVSYLPEACNPKYHYRVDLTDAEKIRYASEICTFGNIYYYRQAILQSLVKYDLQVWGHRPDWLIDHLGDKFMGKPIYEDEKCKTISAAKITLNTMHFGEINGLNCRAFEVAGCGGFQLSSYSPAIEEHFEIGKEIEVFRNRDELIEKVDYYLSNPDKAKAIANAGYKRARTEHTYENRLKELLNVIADD